MITYKVIGPKIALIFVILSLVGLTATLSVFQLNCDFNSKNDCKWGPTTAQPSNWLWSQSSVRTVNFTGPLHPVDQNGYFILSYNWHHTGNSYSPTATLVSPVVDPIKNQNCFQFNYFIYGVGVDRLVLSIVPVNVSSISTSEESEVWARRVPSGDMWHSAYIDIPIQSSQFKLKFSAYSGGGAIALDNFIGLPNQCPFEGNCDFESGMCGWTPIITNNTNYKFKVIVARDEADQGIMYDHTTQSELGHLLQARNGQLNDMAVIAKEVSAMYSTHCLIFWYYRQKSLKNKLEVLLFGSANKNISIWNSSLTFPLQVWHRALVTISPDQYGHFEKIGIAATHLDVVHMYSPINLDDISLRLGSCPQPITCDFNYDMCGFIHNLVNSGQPDIWTWDHGFGRVENASQLNFEYPPEDRTTSSEGMFLYTDFTSLRTYYSYKNMRIDSEYVSSTTGSCLTFYYLAMDTTSNSIPTVFVVNSYDNNGKAIKKLWTYSRSGDPNTNNERKGWIKVNIDININIEFKVSFEVTTNVSNTYIALDDISYTPSKCSATPSTVPPIQSTTIGIPHKQQVSCDFESGDFCGWQQGTDQAWSINQIQSRHYNPLKPSTDHTLRNRNGRYAYVEHSSADQFGDKTSVLTVVDTYLNETNWFGQSCFSLWFYMRADTSAQLKVVSYSGGDDKKVIESVLRNNDWGDKWNLLTFQTYEYLAIDRFNISVHAQNAFVAIDDIKLSHKMCSALNSDAFQCNFEDQRYSSCGFGSVFGWQNPLWNLVKGSALPQQVVDHTFHSVFGHMMAMNGSFGDTMASQMFASTQGSCLTFSYLMSGLKNNETLGLGILKENSASIDNKQVLWTVSGDLGNNWYTHRLTIVCDLRWKLTFWGKSKSSQSAVGIIAVDDVNIDFDKPCPPQGKCDFESGDTCLWQNQKPTKAKSLSKDEKLRWAQLNIGGIEKSTILEQSDFTWIVHSPSQSFFTQYPPIDHTLGGEDGYYLLMKSDELRSEGQRTILMSDRYDIDPKQRKLCLSFYYYYKRNGGSSAQTQLDVYQSEYFSTVSKMAKIVTPKQSINNWIPFNITVVPKNVSSTNIWFYLVGTIISIEQNNPLSFASNLAIDDISVVSGGCVAVDNYFECSPTEKIPKSKVCNKIRDCSNGIDERVCGNCDFENNFLCGFAITSIQNNPQESSDYMWRFGDAITGPKSGADFTPGYMIARRLKPFSSQQYGQTDLVTPLINGAQASCFVSFTYNIKRDPNFSAPNSTLTIILSSRNGFEKTEIWNSDVIDSNDGQWMSGSAYLKRMEYNFTLIFRALDNGLTPNSYVAVDSIQFNDCEEPESTTGDCDPINEIQCSNSRCLTKNYVCDFSDNCGDNSDEKQCSNYIHRTNFEYGWNDWASNTAPAFTLVTGNHSLTEGQTRDHTTGTGKGKYAYLSTWEVPKTGYIILNQPIPQTKSCKMTLWTDIEGNATLDVILVDSRTGYSTQINEFQSTHKFTYERQIMNLYINEHATSSNLYHLYLKGKVSTKRLSNGKIVISYIAIDDISLSPECQTSATGAPPTIHPTPNPCPSDKPFDCKNSNDPKNRVCIPMNKVCDFSVECPNNNDERECGSCSFDKQNLCGWHNVGDSRQKWALQSASQFSNNPFIPHSDSSGNKTGSFIIIDTSRGGTYNTHAIISTPSLGETAANCKLTFYYHHYYPTTNPNGVPDPPILTIKVNDPKTQIKKTIAEIKDRVKSWTQKSVHIGSMAAGFQIWITAKGQVSPQTQPFVDIEIDNIQFVHCEDTEVNWDTSISCDFESGTCGWTDVDVLTSSKLDWVREKSSDVDPGYDHTSRIRPLPQQYGNWMRTRKELGMTGNNTATLMTIQSTESPKFHCLTFWYHMWGSNLAQFELLLNNQKSEYGGTVLWIKRRPQSNNWIKESVMVQSTIPYYLIFRATLQPPNGRHEDSIGLDDITWTDGLCPNQPLCDFETNLCGWNPGEDRVWGRTVPKYSTDKYLKPRVDHTMGLESGTFVNLGEVNLKSGSLLTYTFNDSKPLEDLSPFTAKSMCLKFWYFRSTSVPFNNTLEVEISTNHSKNVYVYTVWTINDLPEWGTYNNQWMSARVNVTLINKDNIRFNGQLKDSQSNIAIDDVLLESHPCEPHGWCDFESDFCGWSNALPISKDILWLRNSGTSTSTLNGPKTDHTSKALEGWYAFVPSDSQESGTAMLISEPLTYQVMCLKFYYQITSDTKTIAPKLQVLFTAPNGVTQVIANISSNAQNQWIPFNITHEFKSVVRYRLILKTLEGNITQSDVAVDDIQVWSDTCADVDSRSVTQTISTTQIPAIERAFDCDFESTGCKWNTNLSDVWTITHWTEGVSTMGPQSDHTLRTSKGHYLLFDSSQEIVKNSNLSFSQIVSNGMPFTKSPNCLSFWYYSDSESFFNISVAFAEQVFIQSINPLVNTLLMIPTITSSSWRQIAVELPVIPNIAISIGVVHHNKMVGALALDDIMLNPGKCQLTNQMCDFSYNYCGYQVNRIGNNIGIIANQTILEQNKLNGPKWDHTTKSHGNYFLFANQPNDPNVNYRTELIVPNLPKTVYENRCLKFWYQKTGQTSNLMIFVVPINQQIYYVPLWTVGSDSHSHWTEGQLTVRAQYEHKIVFSLSKLKDNNFIALDDISITDGECRPPVSCDFDIDWCDWYLMDDLIDINWKWGRFANAPDPNWPGPRYDHTLNKPGNFLYMSAYRDSTKKLRNAYIESMPVSTNQSNCLSFYSQMGGSDASLQVIAVLFTKSNQKSQTRILKTINKTAEKWTKFNIKLDPTLLSTAVELSLRIKGSFSDFSSYIALDDISLNSNNECDDTPEQPFECNDGSTLDLMRVCNFINDCKKGEDETDCGTCDFEQGRCGWTNINKLINNQLWIRKSADNKTFPVGPVVDGKSQPNGYYMIIQSNSIGLNVRARLESTVDQIHRFKRSHTTCRMYFDYYMVGSDSTLRVIVKEGPTSFNYVWRTIGGQQNTTNVWQKKVIVDIGEHRSPFNIEFEANIQKKTQIIAIDDITFDSCGRIKSTSAVCDDKQIKCPDDNVCINAYSLCDGIDDCGDLWDESYEQCSQLMLPKCTFESNTRCPEIFTIQSDVGSKAKWFLVNTALFDNLGRRTAPINDHTFRLNDKGVYLALNGSVADKNTKSRLITFWILNSGQKCAIRLFYYMYGSVTQMGSLHIYGETKSQTISSSKPILIKGNLGQQWYRAILAVNSSVPFRFVIEGQVGTGSEADIAIDDISFSSGCIRAHPISSSTTKLITSTLHTLSSVSPRSRSVPINPTTTQKGSTITPTISSRRTVHFSSSPSSKSTHPIRSTQTPTESPFLSSTTIKTIGNKEKSSPNKPFGPYELAASIAVPVLFLIAFIFGFVVYKRYKRNTSEDSIPLNPTVIDLIQRN